jgi:L-lactate utilization protein LutB
VWFCAGGGRLRIRWWKTLREMASQIRLHTMSQLDEYLEEFRMRRPGVWCTARDAAEHND